LIDTEKCSVKLDLMEFIEGTRMPEDDQTEPQQGAASEGGKAHGRRRRRHSHHSGWEYKRTDTKAIRTVIFTAMAILMVVIFWYVMVARPS
jgi:hypothetical protein